jgi:serine/threonine protein phosphatase 1
VNGTFATFTASFHNTLKLSLIHLSFEQNVKLVFPANDAGWRLKRQLVWYLGKPGTPAARSFTVLFRHDLGAVSMTLPPSLDYPIVAIADLHGQLGELERLVGKLERLPEWDESALVFLGDFVDRCEAVPGTIDLVLKLLSRSPGGSAVLGNHDLALMHAARLDDGPRSDYWIDGYLHRYDHDETFVGYLRHGPNRGESRWESDLEDLKGAIPAEHRAFLASVPWVVESPGHLFLHSGLSGELEADANEQLAALHLKQWDRSVLKPRPDSATDRLWQPEYPV